MEDPVLDLMDEHVASPPIFPATANVKLPLLFALALLKDRDVVRPAFSRTSCASFSLVP